jgi:SAM-dependent methyltransferase
MATYDNDFFALISDDSLRSARVVVPMVMEILSPKSVVDFGCGPGAWLRAFRENGVQAVRGIDGDYIDRNRLLIDQQDFVASDLTQPFNIDRKYDLAVCIEVAEHLPTPSAANLIQSLTSAAPAVLFSAAIPGQGGQHHINEQWLCYWRDLFGKKQFVMVDALRPQIRNDLRIASYLRQNLVLFLNHLKLASHPAFSRHFQEGGDSESEWVHADLYKKWLAVATRDLGVKEILSRLPSAIVRSIGRRLKNLAPSGRTDA